MQRRRKRRGEEKKKGLRCCSVRWDAKEKKKEGVHSWKCKHSQNRWASREKRKEKNITRQLVYLEFFSSLPPSRLIPQWIAQFTWPSGLSAFTATLHSKVQAEAAATKFFSLSLSLSVSLLTLSVFAIVVVAVLNLLLSEKGGKLSLFHTSQDKVLLAPLKRVILTLNAHSPVLSHLQQSTRRAWSQGPQWSPLTFKKISNIAWVRDNHRVQHRLHKKVSSNNNSNEEVQWINKRVNSVSTSSGKSVQHLRRDRWFRWTA